jgi:hypothetical protein
MNDRMPSFPPLAKPNRLGLDASHPEKGDAAFYDWIAGKDAEASLAEVAKWMIDDMKEETDPDEIRSILEDWRSRCPAEEFHARLIVLSKVFPPSHPFHHVKHLYASDV